MHSLHAFFHQNIKTMKKSTKQLADFTNQQVDARQQQQTKGGTQSQTDFVIIEDLGDV